MEVNLFNGAELGTLEWILDGESISVGTDPSFTSFIPLGSHSMEVVATLVSGQTDSDSQTFAVTDTQAPDLQVGFIDKRSGESIMEKLQKAKLVELRLSLKPRTSVIPTRQRAVMWYRYSR